MSRLAVIVLLSSILFAVPVLALDLNCDREGESCKPAQPNQPMTCNKVAYKAQILISDDFKSLVVKGDDLMAYGIPEVTLTNMGPVNLAGAIATAGGSEGLVDGEKYYDSYSSGSEISPLVILIGQKLEVTSKVSGQIIVARQNIDAPGSKTYHRVFSLPIFCHK